MGVANAPASRPEELTRADLAPTMPCCATVVPALLLLLLLAQSGVSQEGQKVKFGARVEQAKSKCSGRSAKCQFGFTFKEEEARRGGRSQKSKMRALQRTWRNRENVPEASRVASLRASHLRTSMSTAPVWSNVGKDVRATINS